MRTHWPLCRSGNYPPDGAPVTVTGEFNDYMPVVPSITTTADTTLRWRVGADIFSKTVSAGTWEIPELELASGANSVSVTGSGTTTFRYREGRL